MVAGGIANIFDSELVDTGAPAKKKHKGESTTCFQHLVCFLPALEHIMQASSRQGTRTSSFGEVLASWVHVVPRCVQLDEGGVEVGDDGVFCVKDAVSLRECVDRNLAFKPEKVDAVVTELSERLADEEFMRLACSTLQDNKVSPLLPPDATEASPNPRNLLICAFQLSWPWCHVPRGCCRRLHCCETDGPRCIAYSGTGHEMQQSRSNTAACVSKCTTRVLQTASTVRCTTHSTCRTPNHHPTSTPHTHSREQTPLRPTVGPLAVLAVGRSCWLSDVYFSGAWY